MTKPAPRSIEQAIDALYTTLPTEFVSARKFLARDLATRRDHRADEVRALQRPTLVVWATNVVARRGSDLVPGLLDAAAEVVRSHRRVLGGAGGETYREASQALNVALEHAVAAAAEHARAAGHPLSTGLLRRVRGTLRALALGSNAERDRLRAGRVENETKETGLDALTNLTPLSTRPSARKAATTPDRAAASRARETARAVAEARQRAREAERDLRRAEVKLAAARAEEGAARRKAEDAARRAHESEAEAERARARVEKAKRELMVLELK